MKRVSWVAFTLIMVLGGVPSLSLAQVGLAATGSSQTERSPVVLLGFVQERETRIGILGWEGLVFLVREGDTILGMYRVEQLGDDHAILRDGATEIRASFRPGPVQPARLPPGPRDGVADRSLPLSPRVLQGLVPSGPGGSAEASTTGTPVGMERPPVSPPGITDIGEAGPQADEENPFAKSLQGRGQGPSAPASPQDNPFLRALRERSSTPASPQESPF
ncbi:MAG: hypothetical protein HY713_13795 [candidate division NC10 bacterium]|nr:hypothetical protein [candidate division NC10 bacterium]